MEASERAAPYHKYSGCSLRLPSPWQRGHPVFPTTSPSRSFLHTFGVGTARGHILVLALLHFHPNGPQGLTPGQRLFLELLPRETRVVPPALTRVLGMGNIEHDAFFLRGKLPYRDAGAWAAALVTEGLLVLTPQHGNRVKTFGLFERLGSCCSCSAAPRVCRNQAGGVTAPGAARASPCSSPGTAPCRDDRPRIFRRCHHPRDLPAAQGGGSARSHPPVSHGCRSSLPCTHPARRRIKVLAKPRTQITP